MKIINPKFLLVYGLLPIVVAAMPEISFGASCSSSVSPYAIDCDGSGVNWSTSDLTINIGVNLVGSGGLFFKAPGASFYNSGSINNTSLGDIAVIFGDGGSPFSMAEINNYGSITGGQSAIQTFNSVTIGKFLNSGNLGGQYGLFLQSSNQVNEITNTGVISGTSSGLKFTGGLVGTITNTGSIIGGIYNDDPFPMSFPEISTIGTLNNGQGAGSSNGSLTFTGQLPNNYNVIISGQEIYGRLVVFNASGITNFGIYTGSKIRNGTYSSIISGISASNLASTSGVHGSASWLLVNSAADIWDLLIDGVYSGPAAADTQDSLARNSSALQRTYTLQRSVLTSGLGYDCNAFGSKDFCLSFGGRTHFTSRSSDVSNSGALVILAFRPREDLRFGAYADENLSGQNIDATVNLGNNSPLIGVFGAWSQRADRLGLEVKVSAAYGKKNATVNRQVTGTSEPGSGDSKFQGKGTQVLVRYGFNLSANTILSPYAGVRYTTLKMDEYTERSSASVTSPLSFSSLREKSSVSMFGIGSTYKGISPILFFGSAGLESDFNTRDNVYSAIGIDGLTPINFKAEVSRPRLGITAGAHFDVAKNQRLTLTTNYIQARVKGISTTTATLIYAIGL